KNMPTYKYRAKKGPQEIVEGTIEAQSQDEAVERLSASGLVPVRVEESLRESSAAKKPLDIKVGRVPGRSITLFSRQLSSLLKSGVSILDALSIIAEESTNKNFKNVVHYIHAQVRDGATFSSPLLKFPAIFSPLYVAMIRTGEDSGSLPAMLLRIAEYRVKEEELRARVRMALAYPILMALVGLGTIVFMFVFVMPRLLAIYVDLQQKLPIPTQILITITKALKQWGLWFAAFATVFVTLLVRHARTSIGRVAASAISLRLPFVGDFFRKSELARFALTLELLVRSGIPILHAIEVAIPVLNNEIIRNQLRISYRSLEQGGSFGKSLKASPEIPVFVSNLIIVGEQSGRLAEALAEIGVSYERDTEETLKMFATLLEPLMILVMGGIIGFVVMAMLLPIFEINLAAT
ncbi:MAG: type II secretion system F family protein, partial [Candidatus Omnitrophota bacterium]